MAFKYGILTVDEHEDTQIVLIPERWSYQDAQDTRDQLEALGYDTRGTLDVITLSEAKKRARGRSRP